MTQTTIPVGLRLPKKIHERLLKERARASKRAGADVSLSSLVKQLIIEGLEKRRAA